MSDSITKHLKDYVNNNITEQLNEYRNKNDIIEDDKINIDDYELADEEVEYSTDMNLLNIYTCYFKQRFFQNQKATMFENIDYEKKDSTNKCLEMLYAEMFKFSNSNEDDKDILYDPDSDININDCKELYSLYVNNEPKYMCKYLLPILKKLSVMNWLDLQWTIIPLKS